MMSSITMTDDAASDTSFAFQGHPLIVTRGHPLPLGACVTPNGVNFALICRHGTAISLVLSEHCSAEIAAEIPLNSVWHRTGNHWHIRVAGLPDEFCYGYRVDGPKGVGHLYDPSIILLDPASRALSCGRPWGVPGDLPRRSLVNTRSAAAQVESPGGINSRRILREDTIIYELHVRGFTVDPSSGVRHPGTFAGLIEKIPYLKALGVTAVELLPIDEFDENDCPFVNPLTGEQLRNFWGYNTHRLRRAQGGLRQQPRAHGPLGRVPRDGQGVPRRRDRGHPRRRLQPHRPRATTGADLQLPRARQPPLLPARRARPLPQLHRLRQHGQQQPSGRPLPDPLLPAQLGRRGRHRRLPLRPGLGPGPRTARATCWSSRRSSR